MSRAIFPETFLTKIQGIKQATQDLSPIMPTLESIAWKDNEEGLLAGTDKDGHALAPLSPRTLANKNRGSGGPLVPRGRASRFIANYRVASIKKGPGAWLLIGTWVNILSKKKVPFAEFHFSGTNRLPIRDLRGIRPAGKAKMQQVLSDWLLSKMGGSS